MLISSTALEKQESTYRKISGMNMSDLCVGFIPAFRDMDTHETHLSVTQEGNISPIHLIEGLPLEWVTEWDIAGHAKTLKRSVIAGFFRGDQFFTLEQLEHIKWDS